MSAFPKTLDNMFGFLIKEPIYVSLKRMHIVHIIALYITYLWMDDLIEKIPPLTPHAEAVMVGVYFTNFMALVSIWWTSIKDMGRSDPHRVQSTKTTSSATPPTTTCPKCGK